jgi:tetrachloro-p-hydroquinone reductive dehalogenase
MKVRLALEEKGLAWSGRVIDIMRKQEQLDPWYLKLNPRGVVPTLEFRNGSTQVVTNSADIIRFVASLPQGNSLLPKSESDYELMDNLIKLADEIDLQILSYARHPSMEKSEKILNARIEKSLLMSKEHPELSSKYLDCADRSQNSKTFRVNEQHVNDVEQGALKSIETVEKQLKDNSFLLGNAYSLADVIWTVVLSRIDLLGYDSWLDKNNFPHLSSYYSRMQSRKTYALAQIQNEWWDK